MVFWIAQAQPLMQRILLTSLLSSGVRDSFSAIGFFDVWSCGDAHKFPILSTRRFELPQPRVPDAM
jgi:hypothetical protein